MHSNRAYEIANEAVLAVAVLALLVALAVAPDASGLRLEGWRLPEVCLWRHVLGHPCPGCGLTRSVALAAQGQWSDSLATHPAGTWVAAFLVGQVAWRMALLAKRRWRPAVLPWADLAISLAAFMAAVTIPVFASGWV